MSAHADKHLPLPTPLSQPWWDACREKKLLLQRCIDCNHVQFYPRIICTSCGNEVEWTAASGNGKVLSYTVIRHPVSPAYKSDIPYIVALIELEEGPVMMSTLTSVDPGQVEVGLPVEVCFETWTDTITMPCFQPQ